MAGRSSPNAGSGGGRRLAHALLQQSIYRRVDQIGPPAPARVTCRGCATVRIDICRATGASLELTPEQDGRLAADIVEEWADGHGRPFELCLSGPAGGDWRRGTGGERLELDAIDLCRTLAGRGTATGLLAQPVPF